MNKIKVVSNPYEKTVTFSRYDLSSESWITINSENNSNSKLVSAVFQRGFFSFKVYDILKEIEQLLKREGFYAEKMSAQFFKGILMIQRNQKTDGEKLCNKSIQFFYDFEENHKAKLYRQFLSEQLNHK